MDEWPRIPSSVSVVRPHGADLGLSNRQGGARMIISAPPALIWTDANGLVSHMHPCMAELVTDGVQECPRNVLTGCTRPVSAYRCASHGSLVAVVEAGGVVHRCAVPEGES
jgi:hypothetical protein